MLTTARTIRQKTLFDDLGFRIQNTTVEKTDFVCLHQHIKLQERVIDRLRRNAEQHVEYHSVDQRCRRNTKLCEHQTD